MTIVAALPPPGLHPAVPFSRYFGWDAVSQSSLKTLIQKSPAHLRWEKDHPRGDTDSFRFGRALHTLVLEPILFYKSFSQTSETNARTKAYKVEKESLEAEGYTVLSPKEWETVHRCSESLASHPTARGLLGGDHEVSAVWKDPETGLDCKARFDDLSSSRLGVITDLKTTTSAIADEFRRSVWTFGYHIQAAHYLAGAKILGEEPKAFVIVAVEKEPPYAVAAYQLDARAIERGEEQRREGLRRYAECLSSGEWPGLPDSVSVLSLPPWAFTN